MNPLRLSRAPERLIVELSGRCNLACGYCCFFRSGVECIPPEKELSTSQWSALLEEAARCGVMEIIFTGGEVFLRDDFCDLCEYTALLGMRFRILSNGTLFHYRHALRIAATGRCNLLRFSLDGLREIHDSVRGEGTHDRVLQSLTWAHRAQLPCALTAAIHRKNFRQLPEITEYLSQILPLTPFSLSLVTDAWDQERYALTREEAWEALALLNNIREKYRAQLLPSGMNGTLGYFDSLSSPVNTTSATRGCQNLQKIMSVRSDGTFVPCLELSHIPIGQALHDSLLSVWQNAPALQMLRNPTPSLLHSSHCRSCRYLQRCGGEMPCPAHPTNNRYFSVGCRRHFEEQLSKQRIACYE